MSGLMSDIPGLPGLESAVGDFTSTHVPQESILESLGRFIGLLDEPQDFWSSQEAQAMAEDYGYGAYDKDTGKFGYASTGDPGFTKGIIGGMLSPALQGVPGVGLIGGLLGKFGLPTGLGPYGAMTSALAMGPMGLPVAGYHAYGMLNNEKQLGDALNSIGRNTGRGYGKDSATPGGNEKNGKVSSPSKGKDQGSRFYGKFYDWNDD